MNTLRWLLRSRPMRIAQICLGVLLMIAAPVAAIPTPPPVGIVVFAIGLALVLRNSRWAKRRYLRWTRRYPRVRKAVDFGLRRKQLRQGATGRPAGQRWWRRQRLIDGRTGGRK
ncbi:hypothetical protein [Polymorphobacter multimanifer]|uniref:Transmembrane protein (PGPGW) n=1 Tax=Polymorphobacter multimanifer TaxID=1070431 RepID=A0A841L8R5_9SPHN|nr:hypothetical protein [Polymorphobacter multimanifer]MBB6227363.1 hypothetical protein [Polymorphobacter multimanifer]